MDINKELESIIIKYNLDRHYPEYRNSRKACIYLQKWIGELSEGKDSFLFVGMDEYALNLIRSWSKSENISILFIRTIEELDSHKEELEKNPHIYVVSYTGTNAILHWFWRNEYEAESVYDVWENENIYLSREFYQFFTPLKDNPELQLELGRTSTDDGEYLILYEYYYQKQRMLHIRRDADKKRINQKLFFLAIRMKNFIEAEKILNRLSDDKDYVDCWFEIQQMLEKIKEELSKKKQNNIIIYWMDSLHYWETKDMEYLQSRRAHSVYFRNAFTVTPYTFPTLKTMLCGIRQVDDLGYNIRNVNQDNSNVIRELSNRGYQLHILGYYLRKELEPKFKYESVIESMGASCSEVFWNMLDRILQNKNKAVYIAHSLMELHYPCRSVRREHFESQFLHAEENANREEVDAQLGFYDQMLGRTPYRIYMSDHGHGGYGYQLVHVHFQVYHDTWEGHDTDKLFCYLDFDKLLYRLMEQKEINDDVWSREYVPVQDVDIYNWGLLESVFKERRIDNMPYLTAYKGVLTDKYMYVHYKAGDELYYEWSDGEKVPCAGIELDRAKLDDEFISELRRKVGSFPEEIDTDPKFRYAKYTYAVLDNIKHTREEITRLINDLFAVYADGSVALRMGGEHSYQLYSVLSEENRRKIGGIIDKDNNCKCKELGYQIYKYPGDIPKGITAILLSSYWHMEELREEAKESYGAYKIIDIYRYLGEHGYHFEREFYHRFALDSDWDVGFPLDET